MAEATDTGQKHPLGLLNPYLQESDERYTFFQRHLVASYRALVDTEWWLYNYEITMGQEIRTKFYEFFCVCSLVIFRYLYCMPRYYFYKIYAQIYIYELKKNRSSNEFHLRLSISPCLRGGKMIKD